jgi:hypothetical protein
MSEVIGTSAGFSGRSLHGHIQISNNSNLDLSRDIYRYQILYYNVMTILNSYLNFFSIGDYTNLKKKLTISNQNLLTSVINNNDLFYGNYIDNLSNFTYDSTTFEKFRNNTYYVLDGLMQALSQFNEVDSLKNQVNYYTTILSSEQSILNYLNSNKNHSMLAFSSNQIYNTTIVLKPWYERYLTEYGAPNDGVFLNEKMAIVVQQLINEGVITMEEFIKG